MQRIFRKGLCIFAVVFVLQMLCLLASAQQDVAGIIQKAPNADPEYRCAAMVETINQLRRVGKDQALTELTRLYNSNMSKGGEDIKICLICRLLFVDPNGWKPAVFGAPNPPSTNGPSLFPLFPIALSDGVPFMLVDGYSRGGVFESPLDTIEYCHSLSLRSEDLPTTNFQSAAKKLIGDEKFKKLYTDPRAFDWMTNFVLRQAGSTNMAK